MRFSVLIMVIVLSIFIVGCAKQAPTTTDNLNTTPVVTDVVTDQAPVEQTSDVNMPPLPPPVPSPI